jgi:hypothetical protein
MRKPALTAEAIYAALALLGAAACGAAPTPETKAPTATTPTTPTAPTPTDEKKKAAEPEAGPSPTPSGMPPTGTTESSQNHGAVDAGAPLPRQSSPKAQNQRPGGSASCGAGTSGPDGKGH